MGGHKIARSVSGLESQQGSRSVAWEAPAISLRSKGAHSLGEGFLLSALAGGAGQIQSLIRESTWKANREQRKSCQLLGLQKQKSLLQGKWRGDLQELNPAPNPCSCVAGKG